MRKLFALGGIGVLFGLYAAPLGCDAGGMEITPIHSGQTNSVSIQGAMGAPLGGNLFIVTELQLANTSSRSFSLTPDTFAITTTAGVQVKGDIRSAFIEGGCKADSLLAPEGTTTCTLLFEAAADAQTKTIAYHDPEDFNVTIAEVPLETTACTLCGGTCVDLGSDPKNCGGCGQDVGQGTCANGAPACTENAAACDGIHCISLLSDEANCGACATPVPTGHTCVDGKPSETPTESCLTVAGNACHNGNGSGCFECVTGSAVEATDGGSCKQAYETAYGTAGDCKSGGNPKWCFLRDCWRGCDSDGDGRLMLSSEAECFCDAFTITNSCLFDETGDSCVAKAFAMFGGGAFTDFTNVFMCVDPLCGGQGSNCL
ncbi:MAG: hypothetical protein U0414_39175 [Polyangiaceae bacterium]